MQYHSIHKNTNTDKRQMVLTYLRVQSLHASSLLVALTCSCSITCSCDYLLMMSIIYISFSNYMHLNSDSYVDVDACMMLYYEMWF